MTARRLIAALFAAAGLACSAGAHAGVTVSDAWVRGTVPAQKVTGAFLTLQSSDDATLVGVSSSASESAEIHASGQSGGVMEMHEVEGVPLPRGRKVELKPGGFHVMLVGLRGALKAGDTVALTLTIRDAQGRSSKVEVRAAVRPLGQ